MDAGADPHRDERVFPDGGLGGELGTGSQDNLGDARLLGARRFAAGEGHQVVDD